jgi:hypothetical protein
MRLEKHLGACTACALYLEQLRATLDLAGGLREQDVSPAMRADLLQVFARWRSGR